jgi:hypothetical protein
MSGTIVHQIARAPSMGWLQGVGCKGWLQRVYKWCTPLWPLWLRHQAPSNVNSLASVFRAGRRYTPMNAVQISGMSGAGKTTIAAVLARRGLAVIDTDGDPLLARHLDSAGNVVGDPAVPDFAWLARHSWAWNPTRLDELIGAAAPATLYVCGCADNELELADRFTQVFLLEIDEPTMLGRLASRDKEWGRIGDTREYQRLKLPEYQGRLRASGAIPIDARRP